MIEMFPGYARAAAQYLTEPQEDYEDDPDEEAMWADYDPHSAIDPEGELICD